MIILEVLNTLAGSPVTETTIWMIIALGALIIGFLSVCAAIDAESGELALFGLFSMAVFFILVITPIPFHKPTGQFQPTRLEVRITDPNYVIDATKFKVVETKGKILVIEEVK